MRARLRPGGAWLPRRVRDATLLPHAATLAGVRGPAGALRAAVDAWIVARYRPDPSEVEAVLAASRAARRQGDARTEQALLGAALEHADRRRRWEDVLRLAASSVRPRRPGGPWSRPGRWPRRPP